MLKVLEPVPGKNRSTETILITPEDQQRFAAIAEKLGTTRHTLLRGYLDQLFAQHPEIIEADPSELMKFT